MNATGHFTEADFNALAFSFQSGRLVGIEIQYDVSESSQSSVILVSVGLVSERASVNFE